FLADVFIVVGLLLLVTPGVVLWFLFAFAAPVVLLEGLSGTAALKRSASLVASDWIRVAVVAAMLWVIDFAAHRIGGRLVPGWWTFAAVMLGDLVDLVLLPFPIVATVLLYLDIRRRREGLDDAGLRARLQAAGLVGRR